MTAGGDDVGVIAAGAGAAGFFDGAGASGFFDGAGAAGFFDGATAGGIEADVGDETGAGDLGLEGALAGDCGLDGAAAGEVGVVAVGGAFEGAAAGDWAPTLLEMTQMNANANARKHFRSIASESEKQRDTDLKTVIAG